MKNNNKIVYVILIILVTALLLSAVLPYRCHVGTAFSSNSSDWANFGSYMNWLAPILTFINMILLMVTVGNQLEEMKSTRIASVKPAIFLIDYWFTYNPAVTDVRSEVSGWDVKINNDKPLQNVGIYLVNPGNGIAHDLSIKITLDLEEINTKLFNYCCTEFLITNDGERYINKPKILISEFYNNLNIQRDYIANGSQEKDYYLVPFPSIFQWVVNSYLRHLCDIGCFSVFDPDELSFDFNLLVSYKDIEGNEYNDNFKASVVIIQSFPTNLAKPVDMNDYAINGAIEFSRISSR